LRLEISNLKHETAARLVYLSALALVLAWVCGALVAPILRPAAREGEMSAASLFYYVYGRVCHQMADRSFHIDGHPMAVCARCFGIYAGFLMGLIGYPFARSLVRQDTPSRLWLALALLPVTIDFMGGLTGAFENSLASRAATGALAGAATAFYILPGLASMAAERIKPGGHSPALESSPAGTEPV
jgi:uncharacterized membrane protein